MALKNKTISNPLDKLEVYVTTIMMKEKQFFDKGIVKVEKIYLKNDVENMLKKDFIPKSEIDKRIKALNETLSEVAISGFVNGLEYGNIAFRTRSIEEYCEWWDKRIFRIYSFTENLYPLHHEVNLIIELQSILSSGAKQ